MLIKIAWRNVWRHRVRSLVVIIAIALGLVAGTFAGGFLQGMMDAKFKMVIENEVSHFQFHDTLFRDEHLPSQFIQGGNEILADLRSNDSVKAVSHRLISMSMMASPKFSGAVSVRGVVPELEAAIIGIDSMITDGAYFKGIKRNPILVSEKIAEKYKLKIRSKIVLTMQDVNQDMVAGSFRVAGIYNSKNGMFDEMNVFVRKSDLESIMSLQGKSHEIAVLLNNNELAEPMAKKYGEKYSNLEVLPWLDLAVGMRYMKDIMGTYTYWLTGIILLALLFSIVNTMLMAVLERTKELGMLMAVGMNKVKVFTMIMLETVFLSIAGGPIGLFASWLLIQYFGSTGIDLAVKAYEDLGFSNEIYPHLATESYITVSIMVMVMAIIAAIFPAWRALKLKPVEAIRKI